MDPSIGRFMTMDSYEGDNQDPQSLHKYVFAKNNSINGNDPSGLSSDDQSIAAAYGGVFRTILETVFASIYSYASSITVFVWNYQNVGAAGHVSMNLNTYNEYVSWWPMNEGYPSWLRLLENAYWHTPAFQDRTLDDDIRGEGREPDHEIHLTSYSEMRVVNWWRGYKTSHSWNVYTGNCAIIVASGLERAGAKGKPADFMMKPSPEFLNWVGLLKAQELGLGKGK
jgi:hypothetical protein